ncbi:mycothiol transferase [Brachybacterium phenoliresistens]|uniref:mycothiol transferase n=1 Tax=Brachybacterium phenoliresistens TaxID=396014 RepID=UPI0031D4F4EF
MDALDVLIDAAARPVEAATALREQLTPEVLAAHPGGHDNSPAWLLWHTAREIDAQRADLSGTEQVWTAQGFRERFALGELGDGIGYGHTPEQARAVTVTDADLLLEHLAAVTDELIRYLRTLDADDLDAVIDTSWEPPVTRGVRLISIIDDAAQHVGQAAYAVGARR